MLYQPHRLYRPRRLYQPQQRVQVGMTAEGRPWQSRALRQERKGRRKKQTEGLAGTKGGLLSLLGAGRGDKWLFIMY